MSYRPFFDSFLARTNGRIFIFDDCAHGEELASRDLDELCRHADTYQRPMVDLSTEDGEAVGLFFPGNAAAADPKPTFVVEGGMIYILEGVSPDQKTGLNTCPLSLFEDDIGDVPLDLLRRWSLHELDVQSSGSTREITLMTGRRRDEAQGKWKEATSTFSAFADALQIHEEGAKDGPCFLQGKSAGGNRRSAAQIENHIMGVDLDSGASLERLMSAIQKQGLEAVIYTTHSHLNDTSSIKRDHFLKKMDVSVPGETAIRDYLVRWKGLLPELVKELTIVDEARHTAEGIVILVKHLPVPKYRAVFPLHEPFIFAKRGGSQQDAILEWKERYAGFCTDMGFFFDESCVDPARLFYLPRHPTGLVHGAWRIVGDALNLDHFSRRKVNFRNNGNAANAFSLASGGGGRNDKERYTSSDGLDLIRWVAARGKHLEIETLLRDVVDDDFFREPRQSNGVHVECPFEAEHSGFGGNGTFVVNASDAYDAGFDSGFGFHCTHNACQERDRLDFVKELLDQGTITSSDLENNAYYVEMEDDDEIALVSNTDKMTSDRLGDENAIREQFNEQYSFIRDNGKVFIAYDNAPPLYGHGLMSVRQFQDWERDKVVFREEGKKVKPVKVTDIWLDDQSRPKYNSMGFYPEGAPSKDIYNTWRGLPFKPKKGKWSLFKHHLLNNLCEGNSEYFEYFMAWCSNIFTHPAKKPGVALVVTGQKGTGKSKAFEYLSRLLDPYAITVAQSSGIAGSFNAHLDSKLLVVSEEAHFVDSAEVSGTIKDLISASTMWAHPKGRERYKARNLLRMVFISNHDHVVEASFGDERRYFVLHCGNGNIRDHDFFGKMDEEMEKGGFEAFMYDLLNFEPSADFKGIWTPPTTPYLAEQQRQSLTGLDNFFHELLKHGCIEPSDGSSPIVLEEDRALRISALELRAAVQDYLRNGKQAEQKLAKYDPIAAAARRWTNATSSQSKKEGNVRESRFIVFPPLRDARAHAEVRMGLKFENDDPPEVEENDTVRKFSHR